MRKSLKFAAASFGAAGLLLLGPAVASASISQCDSGNACLWGEDSYSGCFYQSSSDRNSFGFWQETCTTGVSANNGANSVANRGVNCNVLFFDGTNRTGSSIRFDRPSTGGTTQDPDLDNGGGSGGSTTSNWENRISSLDFCR
ncbi:MAG: peptidase inhibitor family I36 protein [Dermatophilaceae bacterium]